MDSRKLTRTGLLLLLTAGPFLVFLFLFVFGENRYVLDTYPIDFGKSKFGADDKIKLITPEPDLLKSAEQMQLDRITTFVSNSGIDPTFFYYSSSTIAKFQALAFWLKCDTTIPIQTAKGPSKKSLPEYPRLFLLDKQKRVRGVYSLSNSLSVDTLMLELTILSKN